MYGPAAAQGKRARESVAFNPFIDTLLLTLQYFVSVVSMNWPMKRNSLYANPPLQGDGNRNKATSRAFAARERKNGKTKDRGTRVSSCRGRKLLFSQMMRSTLCWRRMSCSMFGHYIFIILNYLWSEEIFLTFEQQLNEYIVHYFRARTKWRRPASGK